MATAEPDRLRRVDDCDPDVCWHLQPNVELVGSGNDAWRRLDSVDGEDLDDVYAVTLGRGDRLDVAIANLSPDPVAALLFDADTEDVFGQLNHALACGGGEEVGCPTAGLHFGAGERATYLLDLYSTGASGDYRLTWTVRNAAGLPVEVTTTACSPNGDGVQDRCATTDVVRVLVSGELAAGRQRVTWTGRTSSGAWLRGRFSYVLEATDLATPPGPSATTWGCCDPGGVPPRAESNSR